MPIYEYRCSACGHELEALQKLRDAPLTECPSCGKAELRKQVSAAGFQLKGSGWYVTDFRDGGGKKGAEKGAEKGDADKGGAEKSSADKAASAPAEGASASTGTADAPAASPAAAPAPAPAPAAPKGD